jgi:hypothetical protein
MDLAKELFESAMRDIEAKVRDSDGSTSQNVGKIIIHGVRILKKP